MIPARGWRRRDRAGPRPPREAWIRAGRRPRAIHLAPSGAGRERPLARPPGRTRRRPRPGAQDAATAPQSAAPTPARAQRPRRPRSTPTVGFSHHRTTPLLRQRDRYRHHGILSRSDAGHLGRVGNLWSGVSAAPSDWRLGPGRSCRRSTMAVARVSLIPGSAALIFEVSTRPYAARVVTGPGDGDQRVRERKARR
jgi:hypothetical protein